MSRMKPLTRNQLASFLPNHEAVKAFERIMGEVYETIPADVTAINLLIEETLNAAVTASTKAEEVQGNLTAVLDQLAMIAQDAQLVNGNTLSQIAQLRNMVDFLALAPIKEEIAATSAPAGSSLATSATITVPSGGSFEHSESVAFVGVTASSIVIAGLASADDTEENDPDFLDVSSISVKPSLNSATVNITFAEKTSGPIKLNLLAV